MRILKNRKLQHGLINPNESNEEFNNKKDRKDIKYPKIPSDPENLPLLTDYHGLWSSFVVIALFCVSAYFISKINFPYTGFAVISENVSLRIQRFPCAAKYKIETDQYPKCVPNQCGRFVTDTLIENNEVQILLQMAQSIISLGGSNGGASILDVHSGALSHGDKFINVYELPKTKELMNISYISTYNVVKDKIKKAIVEQFGIDASKLYLTYPTFFSKITNRTAKTVHDEYWHEHVDKETYPSFHYTSLLYLTTYKRDYKGGRFGFVNVDESILKNNTESRVILYVEPKEGRVSVFTSGEENRHFVEKVSEGERYALTISFTCDKQYKVDDPKFTK